MPYGPDPRLAIPNPAVPSVCFIRNVITRPNIQVGEYTYYDDPDGPERFEEHVTHHYEFLGDRLIIVTVLPGARIGDGAIIGADSVVAGEIPPYAVAVGNPCRVRRRRFSDEVVERLLALRWWDWPPEKIFENLELLCDANVEKLLALAP